MAIANYRSVLNRTFHYRLTQVTVCYFGPRRVAACARKPKKFQNPQVVKELGPFHQDSGTPFEVLNLEDSKVPSVRVRQHVNPLSVRLQTPCGPLPWGDIFSDPSLPLWVDGGSGSGRFLLLLAKKYGNKFNYVGIDIRSKLVERANKWAEYLDLDKSVHFVMCNMTVSLDAMLSNYPGMVSAIAIQFPDPQFKSRHRKRHLVQKELVESCARVLIRGGLLFLQSDVEDVVAYMRDMYETYGKDDFQVSPLHKTKGGARDENLPWENFLWLEDNPIGTPTERELLSLNQGFKISRMLLVRK